MRRRKSRAVAARRHGSAVGFVDVPGVYLYWICHRRPFRRPALELAGTGRQVKVLVFTLTSISSRPGSRKLPRSGTPDRFGPSTADSPSSGFIGVSVSNLLSETQLLTQRAVVEASLLQREE
jgi:hypothetical protein